MFAFILAILEVNAFLVVRYFVYGGGNIKGCLLEQLLPISSTYITFLPNFNMAPTPHVMMGGGIPPQVSYNSTLSHFQSPKLETAETTMHTKKVSMKCVKLGSDIVKVLRHLAAFQCQISIFTAQEKVSKQIHEVLIC